MIKMPDKGMGPATREMLELYAQLDEYGKREVLGFLRGFVAGYKPHNTQATVIPFKGKNQPETD